jgi:hypothetical protein
MSLRFIARSIYQISRLTISSYFFLRTFLRYGNRAVQGLKRAVKFRITLLNKYPNSIKWSKFTMRILLFVVVSQLYFQHMKKKIIDKPQQAT